MKRIAADSRRLAFPNMVTHLETPTGLYSTFCDGQRISTDLLLCYEICIEKETASQKSKEVTTEQKAYDLIQVTICNLVSNPTPEEARKLAKLFRRAYKQFSKD